MSRPAAAQCYRAGAQNERGGDAARRADERVAPEMVSEALNVMVVLYEMGVTHTVMQRVVFMEPGAMVENAARARGRFVGDTDH